MLSCCILAFHRLILSNGLFRDTHMGIGKHYDTQESIPESLCRDLLKNVNLFRGLDGLQQVSLFGWCYFFLPCFLLVSLFGWCYFFLPCFLLPCICPLSFGTFNVILVLGFHLNSCSMLSGI